MKHTKASENRIKNRGTTLVELITTFTLISLFMVAATKVISNVISVYYSAKSITNTIQVSDIIATKIKGEIEGAMTTNLIRKNSNGTEDVLMYAVIIGKDSAGNENGRIEFYNHTGTQVYIEARDGYFMMHYYAVNDATDGHEIPAEDWMFDTKAYMGYRIEKLKFEQVLGDYNPNIIKMTCTLSSEKYGTYTNVEYIECYNFSDADMNKITVNNE
ncbi:MAG: hypothetical protein Q4D54_04995 [Eubacteriales bacterium]|nr:hypothetical protein [Eubacteriales bacterium]